MPGLKPKKLQPAEEAPPAEPPAEGTSTVEEHAMSVAPEAGATGNAAGAESPADEELQLRTNPEVEKKIADFKAAHPRDVEYFTKLVQQQPERAINYHFLQRQRQHENDTKAAMRQMPQAQAIYDKMSPDSQQRVQERLEHVNKYNHTKRFVAAVYGELNRSSAANNRRLLTTPITKAELAAGKVGAGAETPPAASETPKLGVA